MRQILERCRYRADFPRMLIIMVSLAGLLLSMTAGLAFRRVKIVFEDGSSRTLMTTRRETNDILKAAGVDLGPNDAVSVKDNSPADSTVYISSTFEVPLQADGQVVYSDFQDGTVADVLSVNKVTLGEYDVVKPDLTTELRRGIEVVVLRVEFVEETLRLEVAGEQVDEYVEALPSTEAKDAFARSKSRIYDVTATNRMEDGKRVSSDILKLVAVYHPSDKPLEKFTPGVACSTIDGFLGVELGEDGIPTSYTRKITSAISTAYSAPGTGRGSGGQGLYCGTVAVNPNVIPFGTRLYITAADGSFVYGYAIASDTGTAMMDGRVDIDLFFETYEESCWFGKRGLDVYVLD